MLVIDTSALMAILLDEPGAYDVAAVIEHATAVCMSAGTVAEALIVASRRGLRSEMDRLIAGLGIEIVPVTAAAAVRVAQAYDAWGKGVQPAGLNFGDCFAYALAQERACPLIFVGDDFARTDIRGHPDHATAR